jgi:molecular chaperone HtpG
MMATAPTAESFRFQAETTQLLNLVIHSLYTQKDIFLRELISNASDALDRLRFEALTNPELIATHHKYEIRLRPDLTTRTLTIADTGIGAARNSLIILGRLPARECGSCANASRKHNPRKRSRS